MTRAEDKATKVAVEKYPHGTFDGELGDSLRAACAVGYMQAQKDLELTWQDIAKIITIYEQELEEGNISRYGEAKDLQPYCERILEKFNELKQKK